MTRSRATALAVAPALAFVLATAGAAPRAAGAPPARAGARCLPHAFRPAGRVAPRPFGVRGPLLVLSGAGLSSLSDATLRWIRSHVRRSLDARAGNVVVLKASGGERDYSGGFYRRARFASVQEVLIPPCAPRAAVDAAAAYVDRADVVLFAGGDQSHYAAWKGSRLIAAVRRLYARGGVVGGGSAGLAIQGAVVYDSAAADRVLPDDEDLATPLAVHDPRTPAISFTTGLFDWPPLRDTITDTHFAKRDRFGRLVAFLARIERQGLGPAPFYGLGVDEGSVLLVESDGTATLRRRARSRGAYVVRMDAPPRLAPGIPLDADVRVAHVARDGERFDLAHHRVREPWRRIEVDGARQPFYRPDPYR
ncbi:MAG TPA: hypothetical protein VFB22_02445 [Candidatus Baltobacteraceae bacterium]|nr:hypothetical protein [Candidatus Baltobacteraceae bacterium]